jgi:AcrR family transcriptional regulator
LDYDEPLPGDDRAFFIVASDTTVVWPTKVRRSRMRHVMLAVRNPDGGSLAAERIQAEVAICKSRNVVTTPKKPMRSDAARNRARIVTVAYEAFAADGLTVPVDEIARRAGVGPGTVHRHFPTKVDLFRVVVTERLTQLIADGYALLDESDSGEALFTFLRALVLRWGGSDRVLTDALAGLGIDVTALAPQAETDFFGLLDKLLDKAHEAGTVRTDVTTAQLKALVVGCQAIQGYESTTATNVTEIVLDGLRPT